MYGAGVEYALHSLLTLAVRAHPVSVRDLATYQQIPERFLAKVLARLRKADLVKATEGISGGFVLARPAQKIRVLDVLAAVDPGRTLFACAEIRRNCALYGPKPPAWATSGPCRIHAFMREAERKVQEYLASKSLADLVCEFQCKAPVKFAEETETWFQLRMEGRAVRRRAKKSEKS